MTYLVFHQIASATTKPTAMSITGQSIQFNIPPHRHQLVTTTERDVWITESQLSLPSHADRLANYRMKSASL
jgi:hypothetical protein